MKRNKPRIVQSCSNLMKRKRELQPRDSVLKSLPANKSSLNFQSPRQLLSSIIYPACTLEQFFVEFWEKQPLHVKVSSESNLK